MNHPEKVEEWVETQEIIEDRKLFGRILIGDANLEDNLRLGKLHSIEEAFEEAKSAK